MKYVVSGYIGFDNFGDEAIAHVLTQKLKQSGAEKITLISSNPAKTKELHEVDSCGMLSFFIPLIKADVLISGGGSLLQDVTSIKSLVYYLFVIFTALCFRKKVRIYAQGIGPINSKIGQILTKFLLKKVSEISVRDKKSQDLLYSWGINAKLVKDPIFDIEIKPKHNKGTIGIQLRDCPQIQKNKLFLRKLAQHLAQKYSTYEFKFLSLQDSYDLKICQLFKELLSEFGIKNVIIKDNMSINDVIKEISSVEILYAMRFHAIVIGIKSEVKTIAINYDPKVQKIAEEYNLPLIEINDNAEILC